MRANAYAAIEHVTSVPSVTSTATLTELKSQKFIGRSCQSVV